MALIAKMDDQIDIHFEAEFDAEGKPVPKTIRLVFDRFAINSKLADYFRIDALKDKVNSKRNTETDSMIEKEKYQEINRPIEEMRLSVCNDSTVITKETRGKHVVKIYPR